MTWIFRYLIARTIMAGGVTAANLPHLFSRR
jgi:hypothetical protein